MINVNKNVKGVKIKATNILSLQCAVRWKKTWRDLQTFFIYFLISTIYPISYYFEIE